MYYTRSYSIFLHEIMGERLTKSGNPIQYLFLEVLNALNNSFTYVSLP